MSRSTFLKGLIFPVYFVVPLVLLGILLDAGMTPVYALFAMSAASITAVGITEYFVPYRRDWAWWTDRQCFNDAIHATLLVLLGPRIGQVLLFGVTTAAAAWLAARTGGGIWPHQWPFWLQVLLALVLTDFLEWAKHWACHNSRFLWPVHALHHDLDRLHFLKAGRVHWTEGTFRQLSVTFPLILLGAGPEVVLWYNAVMNSKGNLGHSNIDMPMPSFVHYLFNSPADHRLHHEIDRDLGSSNLSSFTVLPDILFGTFRHPDQYRLRTVGVEDSPLGGNLLAQVLAPFIWPVLEGRRRISRSKKQDSTPQEARPLGGV